MISAKWAVGLAFCMLWTIAFSLTNNIPIRNFRNLGILACYIVGVVMFFKIGFKKGLATWVLFGLVSGLLYIGYEIVVRVKATSTAEKPSVSLSHLALGQIAWPIMGPEAIEYSLVEMGILRTSTETNVIKKDSRTREK